MEWTGERRDKVEPINAALERFRLCPMRGFFWQPRRIYLLGTSISVQWMTKINVISMKEAYALVR